MKRTTGLLLMLVQASLMTFGQSSTLSGDKNYISTFTPKVPLTSSSEINGQPANKVNQSVQYFDGLGRPLQTVQVFASPTNKDIVQPIEYDAYGREVKKYLPYSDNSSYGAFKPNAVSSQATFYNNGSSHNVVTIPSAGGITPSFSETRFEPSPLNRVVEQGAPGASWQLRQNGGRTVLTENGTNTATEVLLWSINSTGATTNSGIKYGENQLYKTTIKDENWTSGNQGITEEFKDKEGRVVLKRIWESNTSSLSTYYIYDDLGNLRYVVPPGVTLSTFSESDAQFLEYIYGYHYDHRNRLIEKKIPGKGWEYLVYNKLDQVVATQDANQRSSGEWLYTKYDAFGRVVITGTYNGGAVRTTVQTAADGISELWESRSGASYSSNSFPQSSATELTINYYDDYTFNPLYAFSSHTYGLTKTDRTKGLLTGSNVKIFGTSQYLHAVNYYDEDGRLIQSHNENHISGADRIDNEYNFAGELTGSTTIHSGYANLTIANEYKYDHAGRKKRTYQKTGSSCTLISELTYNEVGQLKTKSLHKPSSSSSFLQEIDYSYNERGWLRTQGGNNTKFTLDLRYQNPDTATPQFNGNISEQHYWGEHSGSKNFGYSYDKLSRLEGASSSDGTLGETIAYDVMGNIISLSRQGQLYSGLSYTYHNGGQSNRLATVSGSNFTVRSYQYDANGNATSDGVSKTIEYNQLNLPSAVKQNGSTIASYLYTASGSKLRNTGSDGTRDYLGAVVYKNNQIEFVQTEEGKAIPNGNNEYKYVYNLKDHLGNTRVSVDEYNGTARVVQEDEYYAFGLNKNRYNYSNDNRYLYNGKEEQTDLEEQYDYGARFYDPVIGRFNVIDRFAEKYYSMTTYQYGANNPLRYIDINGDSLYVFNPNGTFNRVIDDGRKEVSGMFFRKSTTDKDGNVKLSDGVGFGFNDLDSDREGIKSGDLRIRIASNSDIEKAMDESGVDETSEKWQYIERESRPRGDESLLSGKSEGKMDYAFNNSQVRAGYLNIVVGKGGTGVAYNMQDFGNFLWGQGGKRLGFGLNTLRGAAHLNNAVNSRSDNPGSTYRILDSNGDQRAIRNGYYHNVKPQENGSR